MSYGNAYEKHVAEEVESLAKMVLKGVSYEVALELVAARFIVEKADVEKAAESFEGLK